MSRSRIEQAPEFDVCGPLPSGVTVLEASAGTGKTYAISALAARYVAEGVPLNELLLVTFTRSATGELRERIREQLVTTERELARRALGKATTTADPVVELLASGSREEVLGRREHLLDAVSDFDAATIATTHSFCQDVLRELGIAADIDPATGFLDDLNDLLDEVVEDLYIRRFHGREAPPFSRRDAMEIARIATRNPTAPIEPSQAPSNTVAAMRVRLAQAVRKELELRKHRMAVMSFDDLLTRLCDALTGPAGPAAAERLRQRYRVVLIDEFQDTDPIQWEIVRRAFGSDDGTLVLVADPKQAIYAFRGADVYAYLEAAEAASTRKTLRVNWRSDEGLIDAYDALFDGAKLGEEGILYRKVRAADANQNSRLSGVPESAPLRVRVVERGTPTVGLTDRGYAKLNPARQHVAKDLAGDIVRLLSSQGEIEIRALNGTTERREPVRPGHLAVLVRTHKTAALVRDELEAVDVPAVINGAGSVFATPAAREWIRLLESLERPTSDLRAHSAALTAFLGWSPDEVAAANERDWDAVHRQLHRWANVLRSRGVASLTETIGLEEQLPARVLAEPDGERHLTDLRHVAQLLHSEATSESLGAAALATWLQQRIDEAESDTDNEERSRRLDSDAQAVQILTIHRSKGLEFPIVYCPYLWDPAWIRKGVPVFFHDPDASDARTLDVGLDGPDFSGHQRKHLIEQRGEDLRLAYVALTRAQSQAVVWWAGSYASRDSALGRLLFDKNDDGNVEPFGSATPSDTQAKQRFEALAAESPGTIAIEESKIGAPQRWSGSTEGTSALEVSAFDRGIDLQWRRTSFSDITENAFDPLVASEPEEESEPDETTGTPAAPTAPHGDELLEAVSPFDSVEVSVRFGTFVHRILQATDFAASDLKQELRSQVLLERSRTDLNLEDTEVLVSALRASIETPLEPTLAGMTLRDLDPSARLNELVFELPLSGGETPIGSVKLSAIADVLRGTDEPLRSYADRLSDPTLRPVVRGFLTGSIDLVARFDRDGKPGFAVVDYKTNWLGGPDDRLTAWHYRPSALASEMARHHYLLQGLLYAVALHRYLRWRLPGYDPEEHFTGVLYLFLRGMSGSDTPTVDGSPCGVFSWQPPSSLLKELSDVLDGAAA